MIAITKKRELSRLAQTALDFDYNLSELERLSRTIGEASVEKESEREHVQKLMGHFAEYGSKISDEVKVLAEELEEARNRAEKAAHAVAQRAVDLQQYQSKTNEILSRFKTLGETARSITLEMVEAKKSADESGDGNFLSRYSPELDGRLATLLEDAQMLRKDAHEANLKTLTQNAETLIQNLGTARKRLQEAAI